MMGIISQIGFWMVCLFLYCIGCAVTAGYMKRKFGDDTFNDDSPAFMLPGIWPLVWVVYLIWLAFIKPTFPIIVGVYRKSAGKTWKEEVK